MKSNPIIQAPDGSYVDLSKIVAVSPVKIVPDYFKVGIGFDVYFTPEGISFKKDNCFMITVTKLYTKPSLISGWNNETGISEKDREIQKVFVEECQEKMEQDRVAFIGSWKAWKDSI